MTHSTWEGECRALKAQNRELTLQALASDGQASDAHQAQLKLQEELRWQAIRAQQAIDEAKSLRAQVQKLKAKGLTSSRLLSMAEAALDLAKPSWRQFLPAMRQEAKDQMMGVLLGAYSANPVGMRCGVAMSEAEHDEQSRQPKHEEKSK